MEASEQTPAEPEAPQVETGDVAGDVNVGGETGGESAPEQPAEDGGDAGSEPEEG